MPAPAVPAPPPAASVSAIEQEVGRHCIMERPLRGWSTWSIAQAEDLTPRRVGQIVRQTLQPREVDPAGAQVRLQAARLDERVATAAEDKARAAAARGELDAGPPQTPAPASICLQPPDFPRSAGK
jgi:hypothetical protein